MSRSKRGSVVLIEAFVVLCLMFMLEYVMAGVTDLESQSDETSFVSLSIRQSETAKSRDLKANHVAYVLVDGVLISFRGRTNCPDPPDPRIYRYVTGSSSKDGNEASSIEVEKVLAGSAIKNNFDIEDTDSFAQARKILSERHIYIEVGVPFPDLGPILYLSFDPRAREGKPFETRIFTCVCGLQQDDDWKGIYKYAHPVIISLFRQTNRGAIFEEFAGYNSIMQPVGSLSGLLYRSSDRKVPSSPSRPLRRFKVNISGSGDLETTDLDKIPGRQQ